MGRLRKAWAATAIFVVVFLLAVASAISQSQQALSHREVNAAATSLELSAHTLATIELIESPPRNIQRERSTAIAVLDDEAVFDRTGLDAQERVRAKELTAELTANAARGRVTPRSLVDELLDILHTDGASADEYSEQAASAAFRSLLVAGVAGLAIVALAGASYRRERQLSRSMRDQAHTDFLTGLPNRREIPSSLGQARSDMHREGGSTALLYLDLDAFKDINDSLGHTTGDQVLCLTAERLLNGQRQNETAMRLGGDEFAIMIHNVGSIEEVMDAARRYQRQLERPVDLPDFGESLRVSVGIAIADSADDLDDLYARADIAMYEAKERRGSRIVLFEESMREASTTQSQLMRALRASDYDAEFRLEFQPIVSTDQTELFFLEALLRWDHPILGAVSPGDFIPLAERTGEIKPLGNWVFRQACTQLLAWEDDHGLADVSISCNVSAHQFDDQEFLTELRSAISGRGIDPSRIIIEVTESALSGPHVADHLNEIRRLGYRVAIDDFGAGYANLAQLVSMPFDILKVDSGLVRNLENTGPTETNAVDILMAIGAIAGTRGTPVICEGIETEEQRQLLVKANISHLQGWIFSRSVRPENVADLVPGAIELDAAA